jgi:hypothetical protein
MLRTIPIAHEAVGPDEHLRPVPGRPGVMVDVSPVVDTPFRPDVISVKGYSLTAEMVVSLGIQNFVVSGDTSWSYYLYDFVATQSRVTPDPKTQQDATVLGVGLRIAIKAQNLSATASLSLGSVAASATIENITTRIRVIPVGFASAAVPYLATLSSDQTFTLDTVRALGQATGNLIDFLANPQNAPSVGVPIAVVMNDDWVETAATSYGFALRGIQMQMPRYQVEAATPNRLPEGVEISDVVIALAYHTVGGSDDPNQKPSDAAKNRAWGLTHTGPD